MLWSETTRHQLTLNSTLEYMTEVCWETLLFRKGPQPCSNAFLVPQAVQNNSPRRSPARGARDDPGGYDVQSTYFPAQSTGYTPPQPSTSDPFAQADVPFGSSSMVVGNGVHSSAGPSQHTAEVVPAVMSSESAPYAGVASGDTVLRFQGLLQPCCASFELTR